MRCLFYILGNISENDHKNGQGKIRFSGFDIARLDSEIDEDLENQTINAWVCQQLGRIPFSGDNFLYKDEWKITILSASKKGAISVRFESL